MAFSLAEIKQTKPEIQALVFGFVRECHLVLDFARDTLHSVPKIVVYTIMQFYQDPYGYFSDLLSLKEAQELKVNSAVDHRDSNGRFQLAVVVQKQGTALKVHYKGWKTRWDEWSDWQTELHRFAKPNTISKRPIHRIQFQNIKIEDYVHVNPVDRHPGWKDAVIRFYDGDYDPGQVKVVYQFDDKKYQYWVHCDNSNEIKL